MWVGGWARAQLAKAFGSDVTHQDLLPAYVQLLGDVEAEVRTAAAGKIPIFSALVPEEMILRAIMPRIRDLVTDSSQHVRASLSMQISGLAPILGKTKYGGWRGVSGLMARFRFGWGVGGKHSMRRLWGDGPAHR